MSTPKVSIIMPSLNVVAYIRECIESAINQTLKDIEIICVDAGSTDGTAEILQEYAAKDSRIRFIHSDVRSYGYQMNLGLDAANGEYIGILETDDYADLDMFERLYLTAKSHNLDVVKSGFYFYFSKPTEKNTPNPIASHITSTRTFCPMTDFKSKLEMVDFFNIKPTIWSAIYLKDFLFNNNIRFNETPGASYQDASFNFKVWVCAKRVRLMEECFLHYRQDNEASSINSPGKVYCICDEYDEMDRFLETRPVEKGIVEPIMIRIKYDSYNWNYERLAEPLQAEFIQRFHDDFSKHATDGTLQKDYFEWYKWRSVHQIIQNPAVYHDLHTRRKNGENVPSFEEVTEKMYTINGKVVPRWFKKVIRGFECMREHGLLYTVKRIIKKVLRRLAK